MSNRPTLNVPLLRKTLEHIEAHPEEHDQCTWRSPCGSTMCFAGHAAVINGAAMVGEAVVLTPEGDERPVSTYAAKILGLTCGEAEELFYDCSYLDEVRVVVTDLIERAERQRVLPSRAQVTG